MYPFTDIKKESIASLGESGLIRALRRWLGKSSPRTPFGIGDDCAVLPTQTGRGLLTVDPVIYGEHFDDTVSPRSAGAKLFKRNLSDIAAMGGTPRAAVVALAFERRVKIEWLSEFYRGLAENSRNYNVPLVGGDVAQLPTGIVATLTLFGESTGRRILTRVGAKPGDAIYVTGTLGGSRRRHHWSFSPRLHEGAWLAQQNEVRSMMDVSDGLAKDIHALVPAKACPALIAEWIPVSRDALHASRTSGRPALAHALSDGEDYELLFTLAKSASASSFESRWRQAFPRLKLSKVGQIVSSSAFQKESNRFVDLNTYRGFEHLVESKSPVARSRSAPTAKKSQAGKKA
ncbi:MAG TPA: thiamine-phosphate kinase [Opitutaceae bacterium]|nr:thiamine-phosphate kinase [Opitutaceae bacterium]